MVEGVPGWRAGMEKGQGDSHAHRHDRSDGGDRAQFCSWIMQLNQTHSVLWAPRLVSGGDAALPHGLQV